MRNIEFDQHSSKGYIQVSDGIVTSNRPSIGGKFIFDYGDAGELVGIQISSLDDLIEFLTIYVYLDN